MANLQALPNELLFNILRSQHPPDLSSSSLTCRRIHNLAKPLLEEGQEITSYLSSRSSDHHIDLLRRVLTNPRVALYVTHLRIVNRDSNWEEFFSIGKPFMPSFAPLSDRDLQLFRAAFAEQEEVFEVMGWELENAMRSVEEGDPDIALMLLLCLLPRLSCIDVLDNAISPDLVDFVVLAAGAVTGMLEMKCPAALANLSSAFLQHGATVTDIRLSFLMQWAALPAMRTIGCRALSQETTPSDFMLAVGSGHLLEASPRLAFTDLRLEYSCIGSSALIWMLERSKGLKGFYYEYGGSTVGFAEFVPSEFRDALLRYCKGTLERLTLATAYDDGYGYGEHKRFAGSLQDFEVLEMVDMPLEMLVDSDDNELDSDCNSIVSDTPRLEKLVDTLPASLQILRIPGPLRDTDELVDQLMSLLERKEESQPKLTKIAIGSVDDIEAFRRGPLEEACKAVGVILEEWKLEAAHQWLDDPAW